MSGPSSRNEIGMYFHCKRCLEELPRGQSPVSYARYSVGFTPVGLQIWCERHDINICHIDFEGQRHPANRGSDDPITH